MITTAHPRRSLFFTGFAQVFLVVGNTYFISRTFVLGVAVASFGISYIWSINVTRVVFGTTTDRIIYALGAMCGSLAALYVSKMVIQ